MRHRMVNEWDMYNPYTRTEEAIQAACEWHREQALKGYLVGSYLDSENWCFQIMVHHGKDYDVQHVDSNASYIKQSTWINEETGEDCYATTYDYVIAGQ